MFWNSFESQLLAASINPLDNILYRKAAARKCQQLGLNHHFASRSFTSYTRHCVSAWGTLVNHH